MLQHNLACRHNHELQEGISQRRWKTFEIGWGGVNNLWGCLRTHMLGDLGVCSPRKITCSEMASEATSGPK